VIPLDEYSLRTFPPPQISFARIQDFKGLENTAILLADLSSFSSSSRELLYVGMSRARAHLTLVLTR